jgi:excisionase family DNA binding protein
MAQGFYTLDEAAKILGISQDELKQMAKQGKPRSFQDRGTMRFRTQEIEELFRERGGASDPELPLGEAPRPKSTDSPPPSGKRKKDAEVFDFSLSDEAVQIGQEIVGETPGQKKPKSSKVDLGQGPASPTPKPGSDSDVRLVADGSDLEFHIASDSDVKIVDSEGPKSGTGGPKSGPPGSKPGSGVKRKTGAYLDSGVRLVDLDSDSDVKIVGHDESDVGKQPPKGAADSDIRLEPDSGKTKAKKHEALLTEEIDLDAEIRKAEEAARVKGGPTAPAAKARAPEFPTTSPFELSEDNMRVTLPPAAPAAPATPPAAKAKGKDKDESSDDFDLTPGKKEDSSDFDLTPATEESSSDFDLSPTAGDSSSPLELGSDEFQLEVSDEHEAGAAAAPAAKGQSGINLKEPADSGISLEQGGEGSDEIEFELSLDAESTPKPAQQPAKPQTDSDSEFELTIDESGSLAPIEEEGTKGEEEKDIFETDFDVPALEEESGSEAMALDEADTDLDSSDFDIALSDSDMAAEDESGSQVVALDDEAEEGAAPKRPAKKRGTVLLDADESSSEVDELMGEEVEEEQPEEEEEVEEEPAVAVGAVAAPAPEWGPIPAVCLLFSVVILMLVGFMGFEMLQGIMGYQKPGMMTQMFGKMLNIKGLEK